MGEAVHVTTSTFKRYLTPFLVWCEGKFDYVFHVHWASVLHGDLRMAYCGDPANLIGVTLFIYKQGAVKRRPNGPKGWLEFLKIVRNPKNFKLNFKTGEIQGQRSLAATVKLPEAKAWMDVKKYISPPGTVGARSLRKWWAYMTVVDRGKVEHLTRKLDEFEFYFTGGKAFKGRYILRPFGKNFTFFTANAQPVVTGTTAQQLEEGKEITGFLWIKAKDQTPYILSTRAVRKRFISPAHVSGLPVELKRKIPKMFQYWNFESKSKRLVVRDKLVSVLKERGQTPFLRRGEWEKVNLL